MPTPEMTTAAAVYCPPSPQDGIDRGWLVSSAVFFSSFGLSIKEFAVATSDGSLGGLFPYDQYVHLLSQAFKSGTVTVLGLYCNDARASDLVMDWYGLAYADLKHGRFFLGVPQACMPSQAALLRTLVHQADLLVECPYGIAYHHERLKGPDFYSAGIVANEDLFDEEVVKRGIRIGRWGSEMYGPRRYLRGWFRGAYPASLLSDDHVNTVVGDGIRLRDSGLGKLTPFAWGRWLWELAPTEIPMAEAVLDRAGVLVK